MRCKVLLKFADGTARQITAERGANLLDAALASGVALAHQCRAGSCSSCICKRAEGELSMRAATSVALLPGEIAEGQVLACLTTVLSDAVVEFPYESALLDRAAPIYFESELVALERVGAGVMQVTLAAAGGAPDFAPGSFFMLAVPGALAQRAYSPLTRSTDLPLLTFLVRIIPGGLMSDYLSARAVPGDPITVYGPFGEFHWTRTAAPLVMIAGGTGLAPIISILDTIAAERRHRAPILLCFGVNSVDDLFFVDELATRCELMPRLQTRLAVVEPDSRWTGRTGHVTRLLSADDVTAETHAFLCGPPPMTADGVERLSRFGVPPQNIHIERFNAAPRGAG